ncbi:MAG: anti-anti-sigma regulatory factor [Pseudomonadota bacterium]|jgi:anti-anti-sigma factor
MQVTFESVGATTVATATGRLDFGAATAFQQQLEQAIAAKPGRLVVDCAALDYVSSAGLRSFLVAARASKAAGTSFLACGLQPSVKEVFEISGFSRIIEILPDRAAATAGAA